MDILDLLFKIGFKEDKNYYSNWIDSFETIYTYEKYAVYITKDNYISMEHHHGFSYYGSLEEKYEQVIYYYSELFQKELKYHYRKEKINKLIER